MLPQEALVDASSSPKELFVGGTCDAKLTLEYMPATGATAPSVRVTIAGSDGTSTWEETAIPDEYNVKNDFSTVAPGAKITLEVTEAIARLRWCEVVEC